MAHHDRVRPLRLPTYAPELNPMERAWGYAKDKLSCHRWWADVPAPETATGCPLSHLRAQLDQPGPGGIALAQNFCEAA